MESNIAEESMDPKQSGRRRFLKNSAALAGLAVGTLQPASAQTPFFFY
jgi:hypothetical protein